MKHSNYLKEKPTKRYYLIHKHTHTPHCPLQRAQYRLLLLLGAEATLNDSNSS